MRDWTRYEKAKQLRDSGMTFKAIGHELGVGAGRAREMVYRQERRQIRLDEARVNPRLSEWNCGLKRRTIEALSVRGFASKEDCQILCGEDLVVYRRAVALPGYQQCSQQEWKYSLKRIPFSVVNEVRAWLGVEPFVPPQTKATDAQLFRAKRLLESHGYRVEPPNV